MDRIGKKARLIGDMLTADMAFLIILASGGAVQGGDAAQAAAQLSRELSQSTSVSIYYVHRTGEYSYTPEQIKDGSSVSIMRRCGGNCSRVMDPIVQHLREAISSDCQTGQQTVLVELNRHSSIVYSQSGRSIRYKGKCYFNKTNVEQKIRESEILPRVLPLVQDTCPSISTSDSRPMTLSSDRCHSGRTPPAA